MKKFLLPAHLFLFFTIFGNAQELISSDGKFVMNFSIVQQGKPAYQLVIKESR